MALPIFVLLERLGTLLHQMGREEAARYDLLPIHLQILHYLARANRFSRTPSAVAEHFGLTRGAVSQSVALLQRKGLVEKKTDATNRRRKELLLTEAGRQVILSSLLIRWSEAIASLETIPDLSDVLQQLLMALQKLNRNRPFGLCRTCCYFRQEKENLRCALTGEPLSREDSEQLCREWTEKPTAGDPSNNHDCSRSEPKRVTASPEVPICCTTDVGGGACTPTTGPDCSNLKT